VRFLLWDNSELTVLVVLGNEHAADVELDVVALLLGLEEVKGGALGHKEHRLELELTLDRKVLDGKVVFPVVRDRLVEGRVLLLGDLGGVATCQLCLLISQKIKLTGSRWAFAC
jgi:hypothetical protein